MLHTVIFIPGIMGSCLRGHHDLWSEDVLDSVSNLVRNPSLLKLQAKDRSFSKGEASNLKYEVLGSVNISWVKKEPLCQRLRNEAFKLASSGEINYREYPYDWRRSIIGTAKQFGDWLRVSCEGEAHKVTIIGHSMGCLVAAIAMMDGHVDLARINRFICVGPPFLGAPASFRALYSTGYLKGLDWLERIIQPRTNRIAAMTVLLDTFQSFPSLYQLLPQRKKKFVWKDGRLINPVDDIVIPQWARSLTDEVHSKLARISDYFQEKAIPVSIIYGIAPKKSFNFGYIKSADAGEAETSVGDTDEEFETGIGRNFLRRETYTNVRVRKQTLGDGTVPAYSALSGEENLDTYPITGVSHAYMCQDKRIVELIKGWLPKAKGKSA